MAETEGKQEEAKTVSAPVDTDPEAENRRQQNEAF